MQQNSFHDMLMNELEHEFKRLRPTINLIFSHKKNLYYQFGKLKDFLEGLWKIYKYGYNMPLTQVGSIYTITNPIKKSDFLKIMAFIFFVWKVGQPGIKKRLVQILQEIERRLDYKDKKIDLNKGTA